MKLLKRTGCIAWALDVDDIPEIDLTNEQRQKVIDKIFKYIKPEHLNELLNWFVEEFGEYECDHEPCECCGDIVEEWKIEI